MLQVNNYELENAFNDNTLNQILYMIEQYDFTGGALSNMIFTDLVDVTRNTFKPEFKNVDNLLQILQAMESNGLDYDDFSNDISQFAYGHSAFRSGPPEIINQVLHSKYGFGQNLLTTNGWHPLLLLQANYFNDKYNSEKMLKVIKKYLDKGIDISKIDAKDFLFKLNSDVSSEHGRKLLDLYKQDENMNRFLNANVSLIIDSDFTNLISKDVLDIFVF